MATAFQRGAFQQTGFQIEGVTSVPAPSGFIRPRPVRLRTTPATISVINPIRLRTGPREIRTSNPVRLRGSPPRIDL